MNDIPAGNREVAIAQRMQWIDCQDCGATVFNASAMDRRFLLRSLVHYWLLIISTSMVRVSSSVTAGAYFSRP
jgi:hypothetical protein